MLHALPSRKKLCSFAAASSEQYKQLRREKGTLVSPPPKVDVTEKGHGRGPHL